MAKPLKPYIKWVGGKGNLVPELRKSYPAELGFVEKSYVEPFVGGGAVLFNILSSFKLDSVCICDSNVALMNTYKVVRDYPDSLVRYLGFYQRDYQSLSEAEQTAYYLKKRSLYNSLILSDVTSVEKAALFIFLNHTGYNGLYRVNKSGHYNVSAGRHTSPPVICDSENLFNVSEALQKVTILSGDYKQTLGYIGSDTFVYLDPPSVPLTKTASFTAYTDVGFGEEAHAELAEFLADIDTRLGAKFLLSSSDPHNIDMWDDKMLNLYKGYDVRRVKALRSVSCKGLKRGKVNELLVSNF